MRSETKYVQTDLLRIAYREYGAAEGTPLVLLHGFPYDIHAYDEVCRLLVSSPSAPHFTDFYECRILTGIGHNIPQEAPAELADAIRTVYAHSAGR